MRTPAQIAHLLGWPEAKPKRLPPSQRDWISLPRTELALKLVVRKVGGGWRWWVVRPDGMPVDFAHIDRPPARTHGEALAVGLAALETASVRSTR